MENQIIIVYPYRFREFDRKRFEVDYLKHYTNVVIHDSNFTTRDVPHTIGR